MGERNPFFGVFIERCPKKIRGWGIVIFIYSEKKMKRIYKVVAIGEAGVGKTAILRVYSEGWENCEHTKTTLGVDHFIKDLPHVKLHLWDTAGQERFRSVTASYFRHTQAIILVFDLHLLESFTRLGYWMDLVDSKALLMILGNKADSGLCAVSSSLVQKTYPGIPYFETSALTGQGIQEAFDDLIRRLENNTIQLEEEKELTLHVKREEKETRRRCCGGTG